MIRTMRLADYDRVYALWRSCSGMGLNDIDDSRDGIARFLERNPTTALVDEQEGEIIGAILAGHDGRRGFIYHTAVSPAHRREGIGRRLTEAAVKALKECGISKVALVVFKHNEDGNAFWESVGFAAREDLVYRNRALRELKRMDS